MKCEILIQNGSNVYQPCVEEGIEWTTQRKGTPGKLTFVYLDDGNINVQEGNAVRFAVDGTNLFYGYVFRKSRSKDKRIEVTAYDQLRYFKNKDTYVYSNKTASQVLQMICDDFLLNVGYVEDTQFVIASRVMSNKTLFDVVQDALDTTLLNIGVLYCLYDDFGKITLKEISTMKVGLLIDEETGQNYDYESSIDQQTYNQIKLTYDNEETGYRDVYMTKDSSHVNEWGLLQYYDTLKEGEDGRTKADTLLEYYNRKTRKLTVKNAVGDIRIRAGCSPLIRLNLGDITVDNFMVCETVKHKFSENEHWMDLDLIGGEFIV